MFLPAFVTWTIVANRLGGIFDYEGKSERLQEVTRELESADIWNTPEKAQALGKERVSLERVVTNLDRIQEELTGQLELLEMAEAEIGRASCRERV